MKQLYLFSALLLLTATSFAQRKTELGFAVNAGSFTMPAKDGSGYFTYTSQPGTSLSFGVFTLRRMGGHFGISAELLYNYSFYKDRERYEYQGSNIYRYWYINERRFDVQSLVFPMKLHFRVKKEGKLSLAAGLAPCFILGSNVETIYKNDSGYASSVSEKDRVVRRDGSEGIQLFFTAGGQYLIEPNTSIGLAFTGGFRHNDREQNHFYPDSFFCMVGVEPKYSYWMKSLAISLRHNVLR